MVEVSHNISRTSHELTETGVRIKTISGDTGSVSSVTYKVLFKSYALESVELTRVVGYYALRHY